VEPWVIALFGHVQMALDAMLWGFAAYAIYIAVVRDDRYWQVGAWTTAGVFFGWRVIGITVSEAAGLQFGEEISDSVGARLWDITIYLAVVSIGLAFVGFVTGRWLVKKAADGLAWYERVRAAEADEPPSQPRP